MFINELSKKTGIATHTIRYYESIGLICGVADSNVKTNNYKVYDESHIERLEVVKEAQEVGFTLTEIKTMMEKWFSGAFGEKEQLDFFDAKIKEVDIKISQLNQMKRRLEEVKKEIESGSCQ